MKHTAMVLIVLAACAPGAAPAPKAAEPPPSATTAASEAPPAPTTPPTATTATTPPSATAPAPPDLAPHAVSCVLRDASDKVVQCFEYDGSLAHSEYETICGEMQAAKRAVVDDACPTDGRKGFCVPPHGGAKKVGCYTDAAPCERSCKSLGGAFTRE